MLLHWATKTRDLALRELVKLKNENNYIDDAKPSFCEYYQDKAGALKS